MKSCTFDKAWIGQCGAITKSPYCVEHTLMKCWKCNKQAIEECDNAGTLVCGIPQCLKHPHQQTHEIKQGSKPCSHCSGTGYQLMP
jgi:hypothetical protein